MALQPKHAGARAARKSAEALALLTLLSAGAVAPAFASGLFDGMEGSWRGEGSLKWSTGENERMRCVAKYQVEKEGNKLVQDLTCATDSTRLVVKSDITYKPDAGVITGSWSEKGYGINGWVTGSASAGSIKANVESRDKSFYAEVGIVMQGADQLVTIVPRNIDVTEVSVTMQRANQAAAN
jgi:hypothetical protein